MPRPFLPACPSAVNVALPTGSCLPRPCSQIEARDLERERAREDGGGGGGGGREGGGRERERGTKGRRKVGRGNYTLHHDI